MHVFHCLNVYTLMQFLQPRLAAPAALLPSRIMPAGHTFTAENLGTKRLFRMKQVSCCARKSAALVAIANATTRRHTPACPSAGERSQQRAALACKRRSQRPRVKYFSASSSSCHSTDTLLGAWHLKNHPVLQGPCSEHWRSHDFGQLWERYSLTTDMT